MSNEPQRPPARNGRHMQHVSTACNSCRTSKRRCDGEHPLCAPCKMRDVDCRWTSQVDKRRVRNKAAMDEVNARVRRLEDELTQVVAENRLMRNRLIELGELRIFGDISAPTRAPATASPFNFSVPVSPMHYTPPHSAQSSRSVPANMGSASSGRGDYITVPGRNTSAFPALAHCSPSNHARFCAGDEDELRSPFSQSGGSGSGLVSTAESSHVVATPEPYAIASQVNLDAATNALLSATQPPCYTGSHVQAPSLNLVELDDCILRAHAETTLPWASFPDGSSTR